MADVVAHDLGDVFGGQGIADTPAGHGIGLGNAVDENGALLYVLAQRGDGDELPAVVDQLIINFVSDDIHVPGDADVGQGPEHLPGVQHARGVGGRVKEDALGVVGNRFVQLLGRELEFVLLPGLGDDGDAAAHPNDLGIADPIGRGNDHLVAGVHQRADGEIDVVLGAGGDDHLRGGVVKAAVLLHPLADGLFQLDDAGGGGVFGFIFGKGTNAGLFDVVGGGKIGLPCPKAHHVDALGFHIFIHGVNGHG